MTASINVDEKIIFIDTEEVKEHKEFTAIMRRLIQDIFVEIECFTYENNADFPSYLLTFISTLLFNFIAPTEKQLGFKKEALHDIMILLESSLRQGLEILELSELKKGDPN